MLRFSKKFALAGLLAVMVQGASAFSLLGPFDVWMTDDLSYTTPLIFSDGVGIIEDPLGGPQQIGEEYRWNIPVLYYAAEQSFLDFFGTRGLEEIDKAMAILNNLGNVSSYSSNLSEVPLESTRENFRAQALELRDLKSSVLHCLVEGMGLADPVRYTWALRSRVPAPSCPLFVYTVIMRSFDPATWEPSPYVNGTLFTYDIIEFCPVLDQADAFERTVDPLQLFYTAVASPGIFRGSFFTGLTRDDIGGLRYLYRTNNVNLEESGPGTLTFVTNNTPQLLTTSNLTFLADAVVTNNPAALQALFPGLEITSSTNFFTYVPVTNVTATFTNFPWSPVGSPGQVVLTTNVTFVFQQFFQYTFGNLFTIQFGSNGPVLVPVTTLSSSTNRVFNTVQTITTTVPPFSPPGTNILVTTNITTRTYLTNRISGEFVILPPGVCDIAIISTLATNVVATTNVLVVSTNTFGATNVGAQVFIQSVVDYFTNHTFAIFPIVCDTTNVSFNQGIEKVTFVRRDYDSLLGRFFHPITNEYVLNSITNSRIVQHRIRRIVTAPDVLFRATDLGSGGILARSINFVSNNILPEINGPGLIEPGKVITLSKTGPTFIHNEGPDFLDEAGNERLILWGSFDGSTNEPTVYPSGTSIRDYEDQILTHISTTSLPGGTNGLVYTAQLQGSGGITPYAFALAPGSASLPPGLGQFSEACNCWIIPSNGVITGTPTAPGTYTFTVLMTDAFNQTVTRDLTITISP